MNLQKQKGAFLYINEFIWIFRFCLRLIFYIMYLLGFAAWGPAPSSIELKESMELAYTMTL